MIEFEFELDGFDTRVYPRQTEGWFDAMCFKRYDRNYTRKGGRFFLIQKLIVKENRNGVFHKKKKKKVYWA